MSRQHVAATNRFVCTEEFSENLCRCNRILSPQQVAQIQSDLIFCDLLQRQNCVAETKIFTKFSSTHEAICRCDVLPHLVAPTSRPTCTHGVICRRDVLLQLVAKCVRTCEHFGQVIHGSLHIDSLICYLLYLVYHYISYVYPSNAVYPVYPYISCVPMFTLVILYTLYTLVYPVYPCLP